MTLKILFVCTGNICRSPTAEAIARHRLSRAGLDWHVASAGTTDYHVGESPDERTVSAAAQRGYDMAGLFAQAVQPSDFDEYDHIIAMDSGHLGALRRMPAKGAELSLLMDWAVGDTAPDVPDPYYGGPDGFEVVLDMVEKGVDGLIRTLHPSG